MVRNNYLRLLKFNLKSIKNNSLNRNKSVQRPVALTSQNQYVALSPVKKTAPSFGKAGLQNRLCVHCQVCHTGLKNR